MYTGEGLNVLGSVEVEVSYNAQKQLLPHSLSSAEKKYVQLDKEGLSRGVKKFHDNLFERND